jgi:hypothetical protein
MARFAEAVEHSGVDIVPKVVIGDRRDGSTGGDGSGSGAAPMGGGTVLESLLALLLSERLGIDVAGTASGMAPNPAAVAVREELQRRLTGGEGDRAA